MSDEEKLEAIRLKRARVLEDKANRPCAQEHPAPPLVEGERRLVHRRLGGGGTQREEAGADQCTREDGRRRLHIVE